MRKISRIAASPLVIVGAALATRAAASWYILTRYFEPKLLFIQNEPSHIAWALASGLGFSSPYANTPIAPTAQQPPVYPFILAAIFKVCGTYTTQAASVAVGLNIMAGAVTALLLYHLGRLHFGETVGTVAAWLWVLPWMYRAIAFSSSLSSPYLAALGFTGLLLWLTKAMRTGRGWFPLGVYSGILVLLQPSFLPVFAIYGVWLFSHRGRARISLALAGLILVMTPWAIRNYLALGRFIPVRDNFGLELWLGNRPGMQGTVDYSGDFPDHDPSGFARLGELRFMDAKLNEAKAFIANDPAGFIHRSLLRMVEFWYVPYSFSWILVSILGWAGAGLAMWNHKEGWLWVTPLLVFPLVYYVTHVFSFYRHPIDPVVVLLAAYFVVGIIQRAGTTRAQLYTPTGNGLLRGSAVSERPENRPCSRDISPVYQ